MFVLKKVLNSANNCAEPIRMLTDMESSYNYGDLLRINGDGAVVIIAAGETPTHVSLETQTKGEKRSILCYKLFPNMVFEAKLNTMPSDYMVGKALAPAIVNGHTIALTGNETNGIATVYSLGDAINEGDKIQVIFEN